MKWTKKSPAKEGWYWVGDKEYKIVFIKKVYWTTIYSNKDNDFIKCFAIEYMDDPCHVKDLNFYWLGPIKKPELP